MNFSAILCRSATKREKGNQKYPPKGIPKPLVRSYPSIKISILLCLYSITIGLSSAKDSKIGISILVFKSIRIGRTIVRYSSVNIPTHVKTSRKKKYLPFRLFLSNNTIKLGLLGKEK